MRVLILPALVAIIIFSACGESSDSSNTDSYTTTVVKDSASVSVVEQNVDIISDTTTMKCVVAYDQNKTGARPIVLVVPEWWGLNEFPKSKARQLAESGYFALVVDMYGNGKTADNPDDAMKNATLFYKNAQLATGRLEAALAKAKTYVQADSSKTAAIGFCFGGSMVLNAAKLGSPFDGVVSFHGGLQGVPPSKNVTSKILVCNGAADTFVPAKDIAAFKKQLDSAGVPYTFKDYPDALHAFTNPQADENAKKFKMPIAYNEAADKNSWNDMKSFFASLW